MSSVKNKPTTKGRKTKNGEPANRAKPKRVPLGLVRQKMNVEYDLPGYSLRWMLDKGPRISEAMTGGWDFVTAEEGESIGIREDSIGNYMDVQGVVRKPTRMSKASGELIHMYLMKIDKELYDEDQQAKQDRIDEREGSVREGSLADFENSYKRDEHGVTRR